MKYLSQSETSASSTEPNHLNKALAPAEKSSMRSFLLRRPKTLLIATLATVGVAYGQGCSTGFEALSNVKSAELPSASSGASSGGGSGGGSGSGSGGGFDGGAPVPAPAPAPAPASSNSLLLSNQVLSSAVHHSCALSSDFKAWCWGRGWEGQVGDPMNQDHSTPYLVSDTLQFKIIRAGTQFTCGVTKGNEVYCWGNNPSGNLGTGDVQQRSRPTLVQGLPAGAVVQDLGASNPFNLYTEHIGIGLVPLFACVLLNNGEVWCWGDNTLGELARPVATTQSSVAVKVFDGAADLSVGSGHLCVVKSSDRRVYCWGDNRAGEMAGATAESNATSPLLISQIGRTLTVRAGGGFSCAVDENHRVQCWGRNAWATLGRGPNPTVADSVPAEPLGVGVISQISVGTANVCTIDAQKKAMCWGDNYVGQLGNGTTGGNQSTPTLLASVTDPIETLALGTFSTCVLLSSGKAQCWGHGYFGELGGGVEAVSTNLPGFVLNYLWK